MLHIRQHCGLLMICFETLLHLILRFARPWGLILQYISTLITPSDSSKMFSFDEKDLTNAPFSRWVVRVLSSLQADEALC